MNTNLTGVIISFVFVFSVIFLAKKLERFGKEISRKAVHILVGNWWLIAMTFFTSPVWAILVPACFVILNGLSYRYGIFSAMERGQSKNDLGTVYYAISLLILSYLSFGPLNNTLIGGVGILTMAYGDGLAAVVGSNWPKGRFTIWGATKTVMGSSTMLIVSFLVIFIFLGFNGIVQALIPALLLALLATALELLTPFGLDNLTVPLGVSMAYYWGFIIH